METVEVIANIISTLTIFTCLFSKVPQIKHIKESKRAEGINIQAMLMEIIGYSIVILYNFTNDYNLLTYLEYPIILLQIYVMMFYTLHYKSLLGESIVTFLTTAYFSIVVGFVTGVLPNILLSYLMPFVTPINGMAKVSYMYGIIKAGNASSVSTTTWIISVLTNLSRLFTIYVDSADPMLLFNLLVSSMLSCGVLATTLYYHYQHKHTKKTEEQAEDKTQAFKRQHDDKCTRVRRRLEY